IVARKRRRCGFAGDGRRMKSAWRFERTKGVGWVLLKGGNGQPRHTAFAGPL
ncbi:unnamed protein product, partial [Ectocarpus sp. 4 AP-2014]